MGYNGQVGHQYDTLNQDIQNTTKMMRLSAIVETVATILDKKNQLLTNKDKNNGAAIQKTIAELTMVLPPAEDVPLFESVGHLASLNAEMMAIDRQLQENEKTIKELMTEVTKDAWKWSKRKDGQKEPKALTELRGVNAGLEDQLDKLNEQAEPFRKLLAAEQRAMDEEADLKAWAASGYTEPRPASIDAMNTIMARELALGCTRLPLTQNQRKIIVI